MKKFLKRETGQSIVMVALAMTVLLGFAALGIDGGRVHFAQIDLQNAADAAALAGAGALPDRVAVPTTAIKYGVLNGAEEGRIEVNLDYNGDPSLVEVICHKTLPTTFAKAIGFDNSEITARAVAKKNASVFAGEALPFINLDENYAEGVTLTLWQKTGPGDFERLHKDETENFSTNPIPHYSINYIDGIKVQKGVDSSVEKNVTLIYNHCVNTGDTVYVFTLKNSVIDSGKYDVKNFMYNGIVVDFSELALLEVKFVSFDHKDAKLEVVNIYEDLESGLPAETKYSKFGGNSQLVG